jgi:hypothetical protein
MKKEKTMQMVFRRVGGTSVNKHVTCENGKLHTANPFKCLGIHLQTPGRTLTMHMKERVVVAMRAMNDINLKSLSLVTAMNLFRIKKLSETTLQKAS